MDCNNYIISATTCDGMKVKSWPIVNQTYVTISSSDLIFENSSRNLMLQFIARGGDGIICQAAAQYVEVDQSGKVPQQKLLSV